MTYTSVYAFLCKKEFFCVLGSDLYHLFGRRLIDLREALHYEYHQPALIAFAAVRGRRQIRSVGLQHDAVQRHHFQGLEEFTVLERQHTANTQIHTQIQDLLRDFFAAVETMNDTCNW